MSTKETFERAWFSQFSSGEDGTSPPVPSLSCWDSTGNLRSQEALLDEIDRCRLRIAELRQNLRAEEFIELYFQQELNRQQGSTGARALAKRSASVPYSKNRAGSQEAVHVECLYSEPIDSRLPRYIYNNHERPQSPEGLYSEPVDANCLQRIPSVPETLYAKPVTCRPITATRRVQRHAYEEIDDVRAEKEQVDVDAVPAEKEKVDVADNSSEDESVANLVAIRQSVSRLSQWCTDGDAVRKKLEMQAKRLSSRFSCVMPAPGSGMRNNVLDAVPESLLSPTTPSGMVLGDVQGHCIVVS